jgi:hypothetical protein
MIGGGNVKRLSSLVEQKQTENQTQKAKPKAKPTPKAKALSFDSPLALLVARSG